MPCSLLASGNTLSTVLLSGVWIFVADLFDFGGLFALGGLTNSLINFLTFRSASPVVVIIFAIDMPPSRSLTTVSSTEIEAVLIVAMV